MLIADRFLTVTAAVIDLASGDQVELRRLPVLPPNEHRAWLDDCTARADTRAAGTVRLIDFGLLDRDTRFEAYGPEERVRPLPCGTSQRAVVKQVEDVLRTARLGEPRHLRLTEFAAGASTRLLDVLSRTARIHGFVPVSVELVARRGVNGGESRDAALEDWDDGLRDVLATRHLLLIARHPVICHRQAGGRCGTPCRDVCPATLARMLLHVASVSCRPMVLLTDRAAHAVLRPCCRPGPRRVAISPSLPGRRMAATREGKAARAAEAHEAYVVAHPEIVDLRSRADVAFEHRQRGPSRAEAGLREVAAALARRDDWHGAASATLKLGCLLLDRGRALDAARAFDDARRRFDRARETCGAIRASVYLGLAWTDEARFAEAGAALRTARIAAEEAGSVALEAEARLGLARCLYWQGRFDEAHVLTASLVDSPVKPADAPLDAAFSGHSTDYEEDGLRRPAAIARESAGDARWGLAPTPATLAQLSPVDPNLRVRLLALSVRLALAEGDVRAALERATNALKAAGETPSPLDACVGHTALAAAYGALKDAGNVADHVQRGLLCARQAHAPLRAFRLRLLAVDALRQAGRVAEVRRSLHRLASLNADRFPPLLRARLDVVLRNGDATAPRGAPRRTDADRRMTISACPWRPVLKSSDVVDDVVGILHTCHDIEDEEAGLQHICEVVRERSGAVTVALAGRDGADASATLVHAGCAVGEAPLVDRVIESGLPSAPEESTLGLEAAAPVRYAGSIVGAVFARWPSDAMLDARRVAGLLSAASAAAAPHVRSVLDRRRGPALPASAEATQLVGVSAAIQTLRRAVQRAAAAPFPVLVEGESGSGKELVARAIHRESARRARRFSAINCAALTDDLLEAELFGHARGAFTGAVTDRIGLFEEADGGTLFLDEVSDLSARAQAKLLRVLQEGEVRRVGENVSRSVDVRVVAATNRQLQLEVEGGRFRRDLFYRLHVVHIVVPPLRDRPEDIALLATHFWQTATARTGSRATLAPPTLAALARYDWPGNVRELQNVMAALVVSSPHRGSVGPSCLPPAIARAEVSGSTLDAARQSFERSFVRAALARAGGHRGRAAAALGVSRQGLAKLMQRLGVDPQIPQK